MHHAVVLAVLGGCSLVTAGTLGACTRPRFSWDETEYLIAFGDSYTFVQGTAGRANYSFIGDYLPGRFGFSAETLLGSAIVQNFTGTSAGGPNWVEHLTGCGLEAGETLPATCHGGGRKQLWDFAFAGANTAEDLLPLHWPFTVPLVNQTQQYLTWADAAVRPDRARSLVAVWIGINDINDALRLGLWDGVGERAAAAVYARALQPLRDAGFRAFLLPNLPPLDRTVANQRAGPAAAVPSAAQVAQWNAWLAAGARSFEARSAGAARVMVYDANAFLNRVMDHPARYGMSVTDEFCAAYNQLGVLDDPARYGCRPLGEYFWYNSGHISAQAHKVMAADMVKFLRQQQ